MIAGIIPTVGTKEINELEHVPGDPSRFLFRRRGRI
jgi:hypothetical protein